jgi:hypothetical protein
LGEANPIPAAVNPGCYTCALPETSATAPEQYIAWVNGHLGFNPRSQANSNALTDLVVADLRTFCPALDEAISAGHVKLTRNATVRTRVAGRSIDLVLHEPEGNPSPLVRITVEHKTIMTAHGKARWNRYGDLIAYSNHVHNHRRECIAGGIVVVNASPVYENPDAFARGLKRPKFRMDKVVADTVKIFAEVPLRAAIDEPNDQPEALAVIVVEYDGRSAAKLVDGPLAPAQDSPVNYANFVRRIGDLYTARFSELST